MEWYSFYKVWDRLFEITVEMLEALRKLFSSRRPPRAKNQRPRVLFLDRRRKTYHCRNACGADYW